MAQIEIRHLTFSYDTDSAFSLRDVSLSVKRGESLLLIGESGCGKTTLLRHIKPDYMPQGIRSVDSRIRICGKPVEELEEREQAALVGFVGQHAEAVQVTDTVWHELAFGLESLGYPQPVMQRKIAEMTAFFNLEEIYHKKLDCLSGGQKQLVNLASVMVMEPEVLVLDEPASQLDPIAAAEFFRMIEKIRREIGTTIILSEHRWEEAFSLCDRILLMERGRIVMEGTPGQAAYALYREKGSLAKALPASAQLYFAFSEKEAVGKEMTEKEMTGKVPLTVNAGRRWLEEVCREKGIGKTSFSCPEKAPVENKGGIEGKERKWSGKERILPAVRAKELWFRYEREGKDILKACSINLEKGKLTAVLGGNGTGKSTLLHVLAGHFPAYRGKIELQEESIGVLPQNPQAMFVKKTVREELEASDSLAKEETQLSGKVFLVEEVIEFCRLGEVLGQHPFDLSGGQMQKLALAKLLLENDEILLLDEPGKGMDYAFKSEMGELLKKLTAQGKTILMVSHDVEFCARYADVCGMFFDGQILSVTDTREFFLRNVFYTTFVVRMCRNLLPQAVLVEDVQKALGGARAEEASVLREAETADFVKKEEEASALREAETADFVKKEEGISAGQEGETAISAEESGVMSRKSEEEKTAVPLLREDRKPVWKYWISFGIFFLVMPLTIYFGHMVLLQRKYYFISMLLILEAILSFFLSVERRKPRLREIMVIAVFSAITVTARAAFYMVPQAKPMAAMVILSGAGLGGEAGFLVGAISMLVSNLFFGQGPWTPWQMFAMGMLGFLSGIFFKQNTVCSKKKKYGICLFGLISVILVYGVIMNTSSALLYQEQVNLKMILAAWAMGFPFDVIHGVFTFLFLWIGAKPVLEKVNRIRKKIK
ncbi:MAG: ATP-binding cassette domain-containing protein [Bacteroidales bacterium]|nr:ATP-binding cassette domain-containing protein [Clostridium sp.]MCM1204021.1 ATP-binding cassette domain-containing protein [Bacteroidales bacterium]